MGRVGRDLVKLGGIATAAFGGAAVRAGQFERGLAEISTLLDGDTAPAIANMKEELLDMSVQFGQTIGNLTKARYDIISAGFTDAADSAQVLTAANKLAVAGVSDVASTADLLTTAINGLGLEAKDAGAVSDVLFQTVRKGKTTMDDLAASLGPVFATARVAGVGLQELAAVMATTTAAGVDTRESATALNNLLRALAAPTGAAASALEEMGVNLDAGLLPALKDLAELGEEGLQALSKVIPNIRALKSAAVAASDIETLNDNMRAMADAAGVSDEAFQKMSETFDFKSKQLRAGIDALVIVVGSALLPKLTEWLRKLINVVKWIRENKNAVFELTVQLSQFTLKMFATGLGILALSKAFAVLRALALATNKQMIAAVAAIGVLAATIVGANEILRAMGVEMDVVALTTDGVKAAIAKVTEEFPILKDLFDAANDSGEDFGRTLEDAKNALEDLAAQTRKDEDSIVPDLEEDVDDLESAFEEMQDLAKFTRDDFINLAFAIGDSVGSAVGDLANSMAGLTDSTISVGQAFKRIAASIVSDLARIMARILVAKLLVKRFGKELAQIGMGGGAGSPLANLGTALGFLAGGPGPAGGFIAAEIGGLFRARGGRVRGAALGARVPGGASFSGLRGLGSMVLPGTVGLDSTLVMASGGEHLIPSAQVNHAERMLQKTLSSPKPSRRSRNRDKIRARFEIQANRPFRREEQLELRDSVDEALSRAKRHRR